MLLGLQKSNFNKIKYDVCLNYKRLIVICSLFALHSLFNSKMAICISAKLNLKMRIVNVESIK